MATAEALASRKREFDKTIADCTEAVRLDPTLGSAYSNRGLAHQEKGRLPQEALADYREALRLNPRNAVALCNRGAGYYFQRKSMTRRPPEPDAVHRAESERRIGLLLPSSRLSQKRSPIPTAPSPTSPRAIRLKLRTAEIYYFRSLSYVKKGDFEKAIGDLDESIRRNPRDARAYFRRGDAYLAINRLDDAIADYTDAIQLRPSDARMYSKRGISYANRGDLDEAISDLTDAIAMDSHGAVAYAGRGVAYSDRGDFEKAIADFTEAIAASTHVSPSPIPGGAALRERQGRLGQGHCRPDRGHSAQFEAGRCLLPARRGLREEEGRRRKRGTTLTEPEKLRV